MTVYVAEFEDYTTSGESGILGIYDNLERALKRADDYSKRFIRYDAKGPLGKTEVFAYEINKEVPGCAGEAMSMEKETKMSEFTLADQMFDKLKISGINYRFKYGIYDPEEIIITTRTNYTFDICLLRSIPNSESTRFAFEIEWTSNVPSCLLANLKIDKVKEYEWSDEVIIDILRVEKELESIKLKRDIQYPFTYAEADVLATEVMHKYRESCICPHGIVDVIFNDPATIIVWADGSKTVVKAENEKFDPEKGLAMAISKKVLGNKHDYYEVFKRYVGRYEKKQGKKNKNYESCRARMESLKEDI